MGPPTDARADIVIVTHRGVQLRVPGQRRLLPVGPAELEWIAAPGVRSEDPSGVDPAVVDALRHVPGVQTRSTGTAQPTPVAAPEPDDLLFVSLPLMLQSSEAGFDHLDPAGRVATSLTPAEVVALPDFAPPRTRAQIAEQYRDRVGAAALDDDGLDRLITKALASGLARVVAPDDPVVEAGGRNFITLRAAQRRIATVNDEAARRADAHDEEEAARTERTGRQRVRVVPVHTYGGSIPLGLGMILSYARAMGSAEVHDTFDLDPVWVPNRPGLQRHFDHPGIFLFSNYRWSHEDNLRLSRLVKRKNPRAITVHGGPDTPQYERDTAAYLADNPHVDVIVRGEGEATFHEMLEALADAPAPDQLEALHDVPGLYLRAGDQVVRTGDRERITDLDTIPSPILDGTMDLFGAAPGMSAVIETNRGCPYGCTFCDWGSATRSRIRKFDLDRVMDELEWCAANEATTIFVADANFGILERDVEIAERVADLVRRTGFPHHFITNYAKNTVKHLQYIVEILSEVGVLETGIMSLQSMDEPTLTTIRRKNIKTEKYEELAVEFRKADLPLAIDLMLGLPGATTESFNDDLQQAVDRELTARIPVTEVLANSPMNEPDYLAEHQIRTRPHLDADGPDGTSPWTDRRLVCATSSFTEDDFEAMLTMRRLYFSLERFGVLRHVARYVRHETGTREVDFLAGLLTVVERDGDRLPYLATAVQTLPDVMTEPVSWALLMEDVRHHLVTDLGIPDDPALATVLTVQRAVLPSADSAAPVKLDLPCDHLAWHRSILAAKDAGHLHDWPDHVEPLRTYGPGQLTVSDPEGITDRMRGFNVEAMFQTSHWELESPLARAMG